MPVLVIFDRDGARKPCAYEDGETVMHVARRNGFDIEGTCEGAMACSTCHVIVAPEWRDRLPPKSEEENAMLDFAPGTAAGSRLGCQIPLSAALDGLTVRLP